MTDDVLHGLLSRAELEGYRAPKIAIERELRRRDAWDSPAGKAIWISIGALAVSISALLVSIFK
ncbi:MAG: hypothetical protein KAF42_01745 [Sphingopyxis terrae]|nr:hypothetical protein [Sphingopyxis terrae]